MTQIKKKFPEKFQPYFVICFLLFFAQIHLLPAQTPVTIPDANLKAAIRLQLGLGANDTIKTNHMLQLHYLDISGDNVWDLTGMQTATNLDTLKASQHFIASFAPLASLTNLKYLDISHYQGTSMNASTVLSFATGLSNLRYLNVANMETGLNIAHLAGLSNLCILFAGLNQNLSGLSSIFGLSNLDSLSVPHCSLSSISGISGLTHLRYLDLYYNDLEANDLPALYGLDYLRPVLDLRGNNQGFATDTINILYSNLDSMPNVQGNILYDVLEKYISIGDLRIMCAQIDTLEPNKFKASGDLRIQHQLYTNNWKSYITCHGGTITVDKTQSQTEPLITTTGTLKAFGEILTYGSNDFKCGGTALVPIYPILTNIVIDYFVPKCGAITLSHSGTELWYVDVDVAIYDFKYPVDKILQYLNLMNAQDSASHGYFLPSQIKGAYRFKYNNQTSTLSHDILYNIGVPGPFNFGTFVVQDLSFKYLGDTISGGFRIKLPGFPAVDLPENMNTLPQPGPGYFGENAVLADSKKSNDLKAAYSPYLDLDIRAQFANGEIDAFNCALGVDIPIGGTGMKLTSVRAGISDMAGQNWRLIGLVNIETGLSVPILGPVVSIEDLGVKMGPPAYFEGAGIVKVFGWQMADAKLLYNHEKKGISLGGHVDIANILKGTLHTSLRLDKFTGTILGSLTLPNNLPWKFKSLSGKMVGSVYGQVNGLSILAEVEQFGLPFATRIDYGNPSFPYVHFYFGTNVESLYQLFKGKTVQNFHVDPNTSKILIVAGNDANLFDYSVTAPNGVVYNSQNTYYLQDADALQTIMVVNNPPFGWWSFNTPQQGNISVCVDAVNLAPAGTFTKPNLFQTLDTAISLTCNDYLDTLFVGLYFDTDNKDFDGTEIMTFANVTNPTINYTWVPWNVADGEYYIYATIDDGKNVQKRFYANGSIVVQKNAFNPAPQNLTALSFTDSIKVSWDYNPDTLIYQTRVFFKDLASGTVYETDVFDTNYVFIKEIEVSKSYEIWAKHTSQNLANGPSSNKVIIGSSFTQQNNPPHFVNDGLEWIFTQGSAATYNLDVIHLDGGNLNFSLINDTLGFILNQGNVSWTPDLWHAGAYTLTVVVADDSLATDTMIKTIFVLPLQQSQVYISFNSPQFYSGSSSFLIVNDLGVDTDFVTVGLKNLRTNQTISLQCSRSDETSFVGYFSASGTFTGLLTGDTIKASYTSGGNTYNAITVYCHYAMGSKPVEEDEGELILYPNPCDGHFNIECQNNDTKIIWDVFDLNGRRVANGSFSGKTGGINISTLSEGNYIVLLRNNHSYFIRKLIIAH